MHSPYHEIVLESEVFPVPSKELLCLEFTRAARFGYISFIQLFFVQQCEEKGNMNWISANTNSRKMCVQIYTHVVATLFHRNASNKYCPCADLITKSKRRKGSEIMAPHLINVVIGYTQTHIK
jgi:hypothetical protein